jgi:hypothetical protein
MDLDVEGKMCNSGIFGLRGCYEALMGSYLPTFRTNCRSNLQRASSPRRLLDGDGSDMLPRNVGS